jgi:TRAP-type C4-dicarboxylate transport system substrate-binding protein
MKRFGKQLISLLAVSALSVAAIGCGASNKSSGASGSSSAASSASSITADAASSSAAGTESTATAKADATVLRVNMSETADSEKSKAIESVKEQIEKNTDGRVTLEIHNNGELGTFQDDIEAITGGANIVDGTSPSAFCDYGNEDLMALDLMFELRSYEDCDKINDSDLFWDMVKPLEEKSNIKILAVNWGNMPRCVLSNKPVNSVADFKGMIIRTPLANYISYFTRLGATTQSMSLADTYTALQQKTIDACEFGYDTLYNNSLYEVAKYCYADEHAYAPCMWAMNSDIFNSLSEDDQKAVKQAFEDGGKTYEEANKNSQAEYKKKLEDAGVTFVEPSDADKKTMYAAAEDSANDFDLSDGIMDKINQALGR